MGKLVMGLDIGITSVGYGVIDIDKNEFVDYGVRLFEEGSAANNEKRRSHRGARRLKRRKTNRLNDMKKYLKSISLLDDDYKPFDNPYIIRCKGLTQKLNNKELCNAILHITKCRGTTVETSADETKEEGKTKETLSGNAKLLKDKYICQLQLERLNKDGKVRGINNNFRTDDYIKELEEILSHQELSQEVNNHILDIVRRRRRYDVGPGSEKSPTPYGSYRIKDGELVHVNLIDEMRGKCSIYPDEFRAPKQAYTSEMFNLLNDLNNLTIKGRKITVEEKEEAIKIVKCKGNITVKQLLKIVDASQEEVSGFRIDKNEKPLLTEFVGYKKLYRVFKDNNSLDLLTGDIADTVMDIDTKAKSVEERTKLIKEAFSTLDNKIINDLACLKDVSQYHSLSLKAMKMLNKELLNSDMNQMQLLHELEMFDKNRNSTKGQKNIYSDDNAILSPVAKRAHRETFKVINALRKKYGEFDSIVIETTRSKNSQDEKNRIKEIQKINENNNKIVNDLIKDYKDPSEVNGKTKQKVRLYLEQDCKTAYTLQPIKLSILINDDKAYEIDHIIPISISMDDSFSNKVLISRDENQCKGQLTPIQAYLKGKFDSGSLQEYKTYVLNNKNLSWKKRKYLLEERDITKYEVIQEFINRNLNDTSYACRSVMNTLQHYFKDNEIDTKVHTIKGQATGAFRKRIGLPKDRDEDFLHHAIDALIIASLKKLNLLNSYFMWKDFKDIYNEETGEILDDKMLLDSKYIQFIATLKNIYDESNKYIKGLMSLEKMHYKPIKVSHKIDTKPNRKVADETIYSTRNINGQDMLVDKIKNIYDPKEKAAIRLVEDIINNNTDKYIMKNKDPLTFKKIEAIVLNHFKIFKNTGEYYKINKKGKIEWSPIDKKKIHPLAAYKEEFGYITKYSKKDNGPAIRSIKLYTDEHGNRLDITDKYNTNNKKVIMKQISPYRTDFYVSPTGKYQFVTVRYKDVYYKESINKYVINEQWYNEEKSNKGIEDNWQFVCSMHHNELIGIIKKEGQKYIYDDSKENKGRTLYHDGKQYEILKFTATNNDAKGVFEVKPRFCYCKKRLKPTVGTCIKITKFATDVLGNLYEVKENVLKLEFD